MKRNQTLDGFREEILTVFPKGTAELFYKLWTNLAHLHLNWKNYRSLFGTSPERIELLNWAASLFFGLLDGILLHDVVLAIARLTDPPSTSGKRNASLASLTEMLKPFPLDRELASQLKDLKTLCEPMRQLRNCLLAHDDLQTALQYRDEPLPGISRAYIEDVLEKLRRFLGDIEEHFRGSRTSHQLVVSRNDGECLISALQNAREQERRAQAEFNQKYGINRNTE